MSRKICSYRNYCAGDSITENNIAPVLDYETKNGFQKQTDTRSDVTAQTLHIYILTLIPVDFYRLVS